MTLDQFGKVDTAKPKGVVAIPVGALNAFGVVGSTHVHLANRTQVSTNVHAFPWNVLTVDGQPVPHEATLRDNFKLATWVAAGEHDIGYQFHPDRAWSVLRVLSLVLLVGWAFGVVFGPALARALARRRAAVPAYELGTN